MQLRRRSHAAEPPGTDLTAVSPGRRHRAELEADQHPATHRTPDPVTGIGLLDALLDKAVAMPSAAIHEHVRKLRERNPGADPTEIIRLLGKQYLLAVSTSGGAVGAAAATPAVGTGVGIALTTSEIATFFAASSAYALAVASVHGIEVEDTSRRRTLLLATVLGEQGAQLVGTQTGLGTRAWAKSLLVNMPTTTIKQVNRALTRRIIKTQATRQSALALGRLAPFGIGAFIGVTGARALGRTVIFAAERAFGPAPDRFPTVLELAASVHDDVPPLRLVTPADAPATDDGWRLPGS